MHASATLGPFSHQPALTAPRVHMCARLLQVGLMYKEGITYAIHALARANPQAALYVDAGHGGWLGFEKNAARFAQILGSMDVIHLLRGTRLRARRQPCPL